MVALILRGRAHFQDEDFEAGAGGGEAACDNAACGAACVNKVRKLLVGV